MTDIVQELKSLSLLPGGLYDRAAAEIASLRAERDALRTHNSDANRVCIDLAASLAAAISLLQRGGAPAKKAAPSNKMFDQMINDYTESLERARTALGCDHAE